MLGVLNAEPEAKKKIVSELRTSEKLARTFKDVYVNKDVYQP